MNFRRTVLYLLISILVLIFVYNYILPYFLLQNYGGMRMGMGMHMGRGMNSSYNYNNPINIILLLALVIVGFLVFNKFISNSGSSGCKNCGLPIESERWRICPRCGSRLQKRRTEE